MHGTNIKPRKHRCVKCGLPTYNPKRVCVLCESEITRLYQELKELCREEANGKKHRKQKQKAVKVALPVCR